MRLPLSWQYPLVVSNKENYSTSQYIRDLRDALQTIKENVLKNVEKAVQWQAEHYNFNRSNTVINVGDHVLVKIEGHIPAAFPKFKFHGPFEVIKKHNYWSY